MYSMTEETKKIINEISGSFKNAMFCSSERIMKALTDYCTQYEANFTNGNKPILWIDSNDTEACVRDFMADIDIEDESEEAEMFEFLMQNAHVIDNIVILGKSY